MNTVPETLDAEGAYALKVKIQNYWRARGFPAPNVYTVHAHAGVNLQTARYDVRSDMIGGWPRGRPA
jgi:hypothetical protein